MSVVMPTRILIVGNGGREHALAWKLAAEPGVNRVFVAPGSAGIATEPRVTCLPVDPLDPDAVVAVARTCAAELVVVGPEAPLAAGVADGLIDAGFAVFGPTASAARIESSKAFCHEIGTAAGIPMARSGVFDQPGPAIEAAARFSSVGGGCVVKADGLAAGKGVTVCDDLAQARDAIEGLFANPGATVVVEERLVGREASLIALCDGRTAIGLPVARDHKRLLDDDAGPNTGGMGAISPVPDLPDAVAATLLQTVHEPILAELARRGTPFRGALYAGLMLTAEGPVLLECNARFGDPETQVILPRLAGALGPLLLAAAQGSLPTDLTMLATRPGAAIGIVLAAAGYPGQPIRGDRIEGLDGAIETDATVFHSGTARAADGAWRTDGGRILTVVGRGGDLDTASNVAEYAADAIRFDGLQRRRDIGRELVTAASDARPGPDR